MIINPFNILRTDQSSVSSSQSSRRAFLPRVSQIKTCCTISIGHQHQILVWFQSNNYNRLPGHKMLPNFWEWLWTTKLQTMMLQRKMMEASYKEQPQTNNKRLMSALDRFNQVEEIRLTCLRHSYQVYYLIGMVLLRCQALEALIRRPSQRITFSCISAESRKESINLWAASIKFETWLLANRFGRISKHRKEETDI